MKGGLFTGAAALVAALAGTATAQSVPPIVIKGQHFFYSNNGSQFFFRGVAYQQDSTGGADGTGASTVGGANNDYKDPLSNGDQCMRDIPYLTQLRTNVIRTYAIDPNADHSACMNALAAAGIYVISDLSSPGESIISDNPAWNSDLYQRYTSVVSALGKYNNTIGFFAGNEVSNNYSQTASNAFVKAAVRDTKNFIANSPNLRNSLSVGYATSDVPGRDDLAHYYACDPQDAAIDFWGYNVYSWCGDSSYEQSSYDQRVQFFSDYPKPAFFAEYGCNKPNGAAGRTFQEVGTLFGDMMTPVFSGGIVYMYFQEDNDYGLVSVGGDSKVTPLKDFTALSSQMAKVTPSGTNMASYQPSNSPPACPTVYNSPSSAWLAKASPLPPAPNPALCQCEVNAFSCNTNSDNATAYGDVFGFICGASTSACSGIAHNATTGQYGAIGACSPKQQLGFVMNQYYLNRNKASTACDFNGMATTKSATTAASCTSLLQAAGTAGTGAVASPTGDQVSAGASTSKGSASALISPLSNAIASPLMAAYFGLGVVSMFAMTVL